MSPKILSPRNRGPRVRFLTSDQQLRIEKKKNPCPTTLQYTYLVGVDIENLKTRDLPKSFSIQLLAPRFIAFLQSMVPQAKLYGGKLIAVGDLGRGLFGRRAFRSTPWTSVNAHDIYPRNTYCKKCGDLFQSAIRRKTVKYERTIETADALLEKLILNIVQDFPCKVCLATGDGDFTRLVLILRSWGVEVFLAEPENCSRQLVKALGNNNRAFKIAGILNTTPKSRKGPSK